MTIVSLSHETFGYGGEPVLVDVSLDIGWGERVGVLGYSGAGKSTLINVVHERLTRSGHAVALVPQDYGLVPMLTVFHNIYIGQLDRHGAVYNLVNLLRPWPAEREAVRRAAAPTGMSDSLDQSSETLSGGQRQRTAVSRAFFRGGDVLCADEPVSAVDHAQARAILSEMASRFSTLVVALHDVELALSLATRLIGLKDGKIAFDRPATALDRNEINDLYRH